MIPDELRAGSRAGARTNRARSTCFVSSTGRLLDVEKVLSEAPHLRPFPGGGPSARGLPTGRGRERRDIESADTIPAMSDGRQAGR